MKYNLVHEYFGRNDNVTRPQALSEAKDGRWTVEVDGGPATQMLTISPWNMKWNIFRAGDGASKHGFASFADALEAAESAIESGVL